MLRTALAFFILALFSYLLGANGVAGLSLEVGKILLLVFLASAVVSIIIGLANDRNSRLKL